MAFVLDTTSTDSYQYLECPNTTQVTLQISNAAVLIGFGTAEREQLFRPGSAIYPPNDEPFLPVVGGVNRTCDEIRIKSYAPGKPANVKIAAR